MSRQRSRSFDLQPLLGQGAEFREAEIPNNTSVASSLAWLTQPGCDRAAAAPTGNEGPGACGPVFDNFWPGIAGAIRKVYDGVHFGLSNAEVGGGVNHIACSVCRDARLIIPFLQPRLPAANRDTTNGDKNSATEEDPMAQEDAVLLLCGHVIGHECATMIKKLAYDSGKNQSKCPICRVVQPRSTRICPAHESLNLVDLAVGGGNSQCLGREGFFAEVVKRLQESGPDRGPQGCEACGELRMSRLPQFSPNDDEPEWTDPEDSEDSEGSYDSEGSRVPDDDEPEWTDPEDSEGEPDGLIRRVPDDDEPEWTDSEDSEEEIPAEDEEHPAGLVRVEGPPGAPIPLEDSEEREELAALNGHGIRAGNLEIEAPPPMDDFARPENEREPTEEELAGIDYSWADARLEELMPGFFQAQRDGRPLFRLL
ncbi:hypothetical protein V8F20_003989 [Naviculisporaceae sp. PSN 640]